MIAEYTNTPRHRGYEALSYSFSSVHTTYLQKETINCDLTDIQSIPTIGKPYHSSFAETKSDGLHVK